MSAKRKVLITGASGLLGTNMVIELLAQGYHVVALVRLKKRFLVNKHQNLQLVEGDLLDTDSIELAVSGCDFVIHTASLTNPEILNYNQFYAINVLGTKNVVEAAIKHKVKRIVHVSTANVFGYGELNQLGDESKKIKAPFSKSIYSKSKFEAQKYVLSKSQEVEIVVVNPAFMLGAYDSKPSSGKIVLLGLNKRLVFCPPGGKSFVNVTDVAKNITKALLKGKNGESYIFSNENLSYKSFYNRLNEIQDTKFLLVEMPNFVWLLIGFIGDVLRFFNVKTALSFNNMKVLCVNSFYSNEKSKKHLGVQYTPIEEGVLDAVKWFQNNRPLKC